MVFRVGFTAFFLQEPLVSSLDIFRGAGYSVPSMRINASILVAASVVCAGFTVGAADVDWAVGSGSWNVGPNWGGSVPGAADNARINNGGTATLATDQSVSQVTVGVGVGNSGAVTQNGGQLTTAGSVEVGGDNGTGEWTLNNGSLVLGGDLNVATGAGSTGTVTVNSGSVSTDNIVFAPVAGGGDGTVTQSGGTVLTDGISRANGGAGSATYDFESGTLRIDDLDLSNSLAFNWGSGTLTMRNVNSGAEGGPGMSTSGDPNPLLGTTITVTGNLATGSGGGSSILDLGSVYLNDGPRYDRLSITGDLNLSSGNDTLVAINRVHFLRPFGPQSHSDSGSLTLVDVSGTITGEFEEFGLEADPTISEFTGAFTSAAALPEDTFFLEQTASAIIFHYNVSAVIPEPGTTTLLALGVLLIRLVRRKER